MNTLLERITLTAKSVEGDLRGLQGFADLCGTSIASCRTSLDFAALAIRA